MVGTPECSNFFEQAMQLARRSLGLQYNNIEYNQYFYYFCKTLFSFQYVKNYTEISDGIIDWLYQHSSGIISIVVSLIHDAQEIAILNGKETLDLETLNEAYQQRLSMLHGYIQPSIKQIKQTTTPKKKKILSQVQLMAEKTTENVQLIKDFSITEMATIAKINGADIVSLLKEHIEIVEVTI